MKILLVGGSGHVGTFLTPYLSREHEIRILDFHDPQHDIEFVRGSIDDPAVLKEALSGMDAFVTIGNAGRTGRRQTHPHDFPSTVQLRRQLHGTPPAVANRL